jgi:hypothetical protein
MVHTYKTITMISGYYAGFFSNTSSTVAMNMQQGMLPYYLAEDVHIVFLHALIV